MLIIHEAQNAKAEFSKPIHCNWCANIETKFIQCSSTSAIGYYMKSLFNMIKKGIRPWNARKSRIMSVFFQKFICTWACTIAKTFTTWFKL